MADKPRSETPVTVQVDASGPAPAEEGLWGGRIRPGEEVGRGTSAAIVRGNDTTLRRDIAVKVTDRPREELPPELLARFVAEAQITAQLEHPNVVPVHDLGIDPQGRAYFSMKLVRGQSLLTILERRQAGDPATLSEFGMRRLLDVFLQVCQAVEYAHARGVIHRDLKPANIMVGDFGEVLVMDWGIAKLIERPEPEPSGWVFGTPAYMSPEQARGGDVDQRSDLYSLGVILYEILCGRVPFDDEDPVKILARVANEAPRRPSELDPQVPPVLERLALHLIEKDPERRTMGIRQVRSLVHDYIEGIAHEYRRETLWTSALWLLGALALFAFLVWYLTGQSVAAVVALTPSAAFNAIGWLLLVMAVGYPLWGATTTFAMSTRDHDRFRPPTSAELFVSGYLAHRTFSAAVAPLFQIIFIVLIFAIGIPHAPLDAVAQVRAQWGHALIVILVFLFAYLFLLSTEVRFARRIDRYTRLVRRPAWESIWPLLLIIVVLGTVIAADVLDWARASTSRAAWAYLQERIVSQPLRPFELAKHFVFQGTFLVALVVVTVLLAVPLAELLASLRVGYEPVDEASVASRTPYFLRSLAVFAVFRTTFLYAGAMIGCLTSLTLLAGSNQGPLIERILHVLGPSLVGFLGFVLMRRYAASILGRAPALRRMLAAQLQLARDEALRAELEQLRTASWRRRLLQVSVPVACILGYLVWSGSGVHQEALRQLIMPVSAKGWLLILPYALLVPVLLVRDPVHVFILGRRARRLEREGS